MEIKDTNVVKSYDLVQKKCRYVNKRVSSVCKTLP